MQVKLEEKPSQGSNPLVIKNMMSPLKDINISPEMKEDLMDSVSTGTKAIVTLKISVAILMKNLHTATFKKDVEELILVDFSMLVRIF